MAQITCWGKVQVLSDRIAKGELELLADFIAKFPKPSIEPKSSTILCAITELLGNNDGAWSYLHEWATKQ